MKNFYLLTLLCCFVMACNISSYGQDNNKKQSGKVKLFEMMKDQSINFNDVKEYADEYFKTFSKGKGSGYKQYKRWEYFVGRRTFPNGVRSIAAQAWEETKKFKQAKAGLKSQLKSSSSWTELGPKTSSNVTTHWAPGIGRINDIAIDPSNNNIIYVGTPAGGLWKTTNDGGTWTPLTDNLPVIGISGIAIDPANTNTIYIGTGDRDASDTYGIGVLKSTDGGASFSLTGLQWSLYDFRAVGVIRVNPENSNIVMVGTSSGLYRSTDAGTSWTKVLDGDCEDVEFKPGNASTVYAISKQTNAVFYKSTDGGQTFSQVTSGLPTSKRAFISVTAANASYVYLLSANSSGYFGGIYRSSNSGSSFSLRGNSPDVFGYEAGDGYTQYWYDLCLAVSPLNANEVHIGAITTWKSSDGGQSFTQTSKWYYPDWLSNQNSYRYIHCDMHALEFSSNGTLYSGSDGMICKSTDGFSTHANTTNLSEGLGIRQFYGIGLAVTDENKYIGGSQDNGTSVTINGQWAEWLGADGGDCKIDWSNANILYGTTQSGQSWYQSTDGGNTLIGKNSPGTGNWVIPWVMDYNNPNILYVGTTQVRKTSNQMGSWTSISNFTDGNNIDALAIAPSNSNYLYVSKKVSSVQRFYVTKNGGSSWTDITGTLPNLANTYITVHPSDPEKIAVSFSGYTDGQKVFTSSDAGSTWNNKSDNLPNLPANCVLYHDGSEDGLYVGMDVGIYYRDNTTTNWEEFYTGLPNVIVNELEIHYGSGKIRAATFGRGLWESAIATSSNLTADFTADKTTLKPGESVQFTDNSSASGTSITSWQWAFDGGSPATYNGQSPPAVTYANEGSFEVSLTITGANGNSVTKTASNFINVSNSSCTNVIFNLTLDNYPEETTWAIKDNQGNVLHSGGPYSTPADKGVTKTSEFCLDEGCYDFVIEDSYGDGMSVSPVGSFELKDEAGTVLAAGSGNDFTSSLTKNFCIGGQVILNPPVLTSSNITENSVDLSWTYETNSSGTINYEIYQDGNVVNTTTSTSATVAGLAASTSYDFYVVAVEASGDKSPQSNTVSITTLESSDDGGALVSGVVSNGNMDASDDVDMWYIDVAANATSMRVVMECGSSDFDTYGKFNAQPTTTSYDWRGYTSGGEDNTVNNPQEGRHYILVKHYSGSGAYTLTATVTYEVVDTSLSYCDASGTNGPEYISRVQLASVDKTSTRTSYSDFTSNTAQLNAGGTYPITVSIGSAYNGDKVSCWADWNADGVFDSGEKTALTVSGSSATGNIIVPSTAQGQARLRIRLFYYAASDDPCGAKSYGEVEDYKLSVIATPAKESFINDAMVGARVYPNPAKEKLNIELLGLKDVDIQLINLNGQVMLSKQLQSKKTELDISGFIKGVYMLKIITINKVLQKTIIIE